MAEKKFLVDINLNKNEIKQAVVENSGSNPSSPKDGQVYYNTTAGAKAIKYYKTNAWKSLLDEDSADNFVPTTREVNGKALSQNITIAGTDIPISTSNNTTVKDYVDNLDIEITGAASTIKDDNLTADRALISNASGKVAVSSITSTELGYLDGVSSNIQDQIDDLQARGRFLSIWNCSTGLPQTNPSSTLPFEYKTGDYYIVGVVGTTNYKPNGSSYTGSASSTVESGTVSVNDTYYFDGTKWILQINSGSASVTFASIAGQPTDNTNLANALNLKANLASPTFTGTPKAPTATAGTNNTQIATTAFVQSAIANNSITLTATNPALTPSGGVCTWTITNTLNNADVICSVREVSGGAEVGVSITYATSTITIKINSTTNIAVGTYKAVIIGQKIS